MNATNNTYDTLRTNLINQIKHLKDNEFDALALRLFQFQADYNPIYKKYLNLVGVKPHNIKKVIDIPFLPIEFYKNHQIQSGAWEPEHVFRSSTTTSVTPSQHLIRSLKWYNQLTDQCFYSHFGKSPREFEVLALLPSYLERKDASLVFMVKSFMEDSPQDNFFLNDFKGLYERIKTSSKPVILFGVTFALLDFIDTFSGDFPRLTVIETGGMKGRRKEIVKQEVLYLLNQGFRGSRVISEYGMTELLSQAYSDTNGVFYPKWTFKVFPRSIDDPLRPGNYRQHVALNIVDLGNIDTCAFIATDDIGKIYTDGSFEVLGRLDYSALRGCSLMYS